MMLKLQCNITAILQLLFLAGIGFSGTSNAQPKDPNEVDLQIYLKNLTNDAQARPVKLQKSVTKVDIRYFPEQVINMDGNSETMTMSGLLYVAWNDEHLQWDPDDFSGATFTRVLAGNIWTPGFDVFNSAAKPTTIVSHPSKDQVSIYFNGLVLFSRKVRLTTSCNFNIIKFPSDAQTCSVELALLGYANTEVKLDTDELYNSTSFYSPSNEWRLNTTDGPGWSNYITVKTFNPLPTYFSRANKIPVYVYKISLFRERGYYDVMMIMPLVFISILMILVFFLPVESGEKISLAITVLLAYTIFLLLMDSATPKSKNLPYLSIYITSLMGVSTLSIYVSAMVLNMYHKDPSKKMGDIQRAFIFKFLARIVCFRPCGKGGERITKSENNSTNTSSTSLDPNKNEKVTKEGKKSAKEDEKVTQQNGKLVKEDKIVAKENGKGSSDVELTNIQLSGGEEATLWQAAALILDKFLLIIGTIILATLMITFLVVLIMY